MGAHDRPINSLARKQRLGYLTRTLCDSGFPGRAASGNLNGLSDRRPLNSIFLRVHPDIPPGLR